MIEVYNAYKEDLSDFCHYTKTEMPTLGSAIPLDRISSIQCKNSCVEAIASKWRLNVHTLLLGDTTWADDDFHDTLNSIKSLYIVLLDELDVLLKKQEQSTQFRALKEQAKVHFTAL